jgi:hypothetical protein
MRTANCHDTAGLGRFKRKASPTLLVLAVAAALGGLLTGCLPTAVHPVYQAGDLVLDPNLPGIWKSADGRNSWTFSAGEGKSYKLQVQAEEQRIECVAHLFKLGSELFLDLYPTTQALEKNLENNPYSLALIPAHVFFRVRATAPKLRLSCLGLDWLKEYLKHNPNAAAYVVLPDGRVALTGGTEALQAFIKLHLDDTSAWNDMYEDGLVRVPGKPGEKTSR